MEIFATCLLLFAGFMFATWTCKGEGKRDKPHTPKAPAPPPEPAKEEIPKKDISEPVISFVNFLKANPENFYLKKRTAELARHRAVNSFILLDKKNRKKYVYNVCMSVISCKKYFIPISVSFLTDDEKEYLLEAHEWGQKYISEKTKKAEEEKASIEREEYKKIYCGEVL